jgi:hypothetical protein
MVREPTDNYCWYSNPRTLSGGLLKPIPVTQSGEQITGTITEQSGVKKISYVCPKGFNGRYSVILQKDWGELANNMIKISVDTNIVLGEKGREGTSLQMKPDGVIIVFELETGRRTESVEQGELDVASVRMSAAQKILARNNALKRLADDSLLGQIIGSGGYETSSFYSSNSSSGGNAASIAMAARSGYPFYYGPSAVGYRPIITQLPDGVQLSSNAVVSADRRYVRLSPSPSFNAIRSVYSFNMGSGDTDDISSIMGGSSGSSYGGSSYGGSSYGGGSYGGSSYGGGYGGGY